MRRKDSWEDRENFHGGWSKKFNFKEARSQSSDRAKLNLDSDLLASVSPWCNHQAIAHHCTCTSFLAKIFTYQLPWQMTKLCKITSTPINPLNQFRSHGNFMQNFSRQPFLLPLQFPSEICISLARWPLCLRSNSDIHLPYLIFIVWFPQWIIEHHDAWAVFVLRSPITIFLCALLVPFTLPEGSKKRFLALDNRERCGLGTGYCLPAPWRSLGWRVFCSFFLCSGKHVESHKRSWTSALPSPSASESARLLRHSPRDG